MFDGLANLVLGKRLTAAPDLPPGALPPDIVVREGRLIPWLGGVLARMSGSAAAVTLGRTIVINRGVQLTASLLTHELVHVRQWQRDPLFPLRYSLATLRFGYHDNPYEVEARTLATSMWPSPADEERT